MPRGKMCVFTGGTFLSKHTCDGSSFHTRESKKKCTIVCNTNRNKHKIFNI